MYVSIYMLYVNGECTLAFKELTFRLLLHKALSSGSQALDVLDGSPRVVCRPHIVCKWTHTIIILCMCPFTHT